MHSFFFLAVLKWVECIPTVLFIQYFTKCKIKKIKGAADENGLKNVICKKALNGWLCVLCFKRLKKHKTQNHDGVQIRWSWVNSPVITACLQGGLGVTVVASELPKNGTAQSPLYSHFFGRLSPFLMSKHLVTYPIKAHFITGRNEVLAKVMFLQVCVILFTGRDVWSGPGGVRHPPPGRHPHQVRHPPGQTPPRADTPPGQIPPPGQTPPPPRSSRLRNTVNDRPVRILLECILVCNSFRKPSPF